MTFKMDPVRAARKRIHDLINKGHNVALVDKKTRQIVMSAHNKDALRLFIHFRPDLELVMLQQLLDELPAPLADKRVQPGTA